MRYISRKFILIIILIICATILTYRSELSTKDWIEYTWKLFAAYAVGNGIGKINNHFNKEVDDNDNKDSN